MPLLLLLLATTVRDVIPGSDTAIVRSEVNATGIAAVEAYGLDAKKDVCL
jgi:hypothetical protein